MRRTLEEELRASLELIEASLCESEEENLCQHLHSFTDDPLGSSALFHHVFGLG